MGLSSLRGVSAASLPSVWQWSDLDELMDTEACPRSGLSWSAQLEIKLSHWGWGQKTPHGLP